MPDPLSYQPSRSAVYYTAPQRLDVRRTITGFTIAAVLTIAGAIVYGHLQPHLRWIYVRIGGVVAAALAVGGLGLIPVRFGKVRTPIVAAFAGAILSLLALYVMWVVWMHDVLNRALPYPVPYDVLLRHPLGLMDLIRDINDVGTWSYRENVVRGWPLALLWILEAGILIGVGIMIPIRAVFGDDPTCLTCGRKCVRVRDLPRFDAERQNDFLAAIENRDFPALASHEAPAHEDDPELTLRLLTCPTCHQTNVLTVSHVAWYVDAKTGARKVRSNALIAQLLITPEEAEQLKTVFADIRRHRTSDSEDDQTEEATESEASTRDGEDSVSGH